MEDKFNGILLLSLTDEYYMAIGAILSKWATLEYQLKRIMWTAMELGPKEARMLTAGAGLTQILSVLRSLHLRWIKDPTIIAALKTLIEETSNLSEQRNYLAHGVWMAKEGEEGIPHLTYMKTAKERILPGAEALTPANLHVLAKSIAKLNELAEAVHRQVRLERKALQKKPE